MIHKFFPTSVYVAPLLSNPRQLKSFLKEVKSDVLKIRDFDLEGQDWSDSHYPGGYTSYSSIAELHQFSSVFAELRDHLDQHVKKFARTLDADLKNYPLSMTESWVNIMPPMCVHTGHIHPNASISGTFYVETPKGSSPLKFEDPRLSSFMGAVPKKPQVKDMNRHFICVPAIEGQVTLFESWLRHEVPPNTTQKDRLSISFNYNWF
ncbi:hypothetical protein GW916_01195 [bacterium]|nr:hypothetical protein [bacterium]